MHNNKGDFVGHPCPCCGFLTFSEEPSGTFEICPVCYWEDDIVQLQDPEFTGGANEVSLNEARDNFKKMKASQSRFKTSVRPPFDNEMPIQ